MFKNMKAKDRMILFGIIGLLIIYAWGTTVSLSIPGLDTILYVRAKVEGGGDLEGVPVTISVGSWDRDPYPAFMNTPVMYACMPGVEYEVKVQLSVPMGGVDYYFVRWENGWEVPVRYYSFMSGKASFIMTAFYSTVDPGPRKEPINLKFVVNHVANPDVCNLAFFEGLLSTAHTGEPLNNRDIKIYERMNSSEWTHILTLQTKHQAPSQYFEQYYDGYELDGIFRGTTHPEGVAKQGIATFEWYAEFEGDEFLDSMTTDIVSVVWRNTGKLTTQLTISFTKKPSEVNAEAIVGGTLKGEKSDGGLYVGLAGKQVYIVEMQRDPNNPDLPLTTAVGYATTDADGRWTYTLTAPHFEKWYERVGYHATFGKISLMQGMTSPDSTPGWGEDDSVYMSRISNTVYADIENLEYAPDSVDLFPWFPDFLKGGGLGLLTVIQWIPLFIGGLLLYKFLDVVKSRRR